MAPQLQAEPTEADYWTNSAYAIGGSAAGNGAIFLSILMLDLAPLLFTGEEEEPADLISSAGPWLFLLGLIPIISTPWIMHANSPEADWDSIVWTSLGSLLSVLLHSLLIVLPLSFAFQQESPTQTFYLVAPAAMLTGILLEGLVSAQFHQFSERWQVSGAPRGGIMLSHQIDF